MKTISLLFLTLFPAIAQQDLSVKYALVNQASIPESMSSDTIGVMVFTKVNNPLIGKIEIHLAFIDVNGTERVLTKTVNREVTRAGYQPFVLPTLFTANVARVVSVISYGWTVTSVTLVN